MTEHEMREFREHCNKMIEVFAERGMKDRVASVEICREYFTNPAFRAWMHEYAWKTVGEPMWKRANPSKE